MLMKATSSTPALRASMATNLLSTNTRMKHAPKCRLRYEGWVGEWYKLCDHCAVERVAFICNGSRHLVGKELENIVVMMVARTMEAVETEMMRLGAIVAPYWALVDGEMACSATVPRVTAATRHLGSLAGNSSDAKFTRCPGLF